MRKTLYVTPRKTKEGLDWAVLPQNAKRPIKITENKKDAILIARNIAKNADLGQIKIQRKDGKFQREYTYGKDPEKYLS